MTTFKENRLKTIFQIAQKKVSIYFTAGYPALSDTAPILELLASEKIDFVEIGIPFSDSVMDGDVILDSHKVALENGMTLDILFHQLEKVRDLISIPIVLMGSMNPVYQYGFERFCQRCNEAGVDGLLLPDLPLDDYEKYYRVWYQQNNIAPIFMISPQTSDERLSRIDNLGEGFLYALSGNSTTGGPGVIRDNSNYLQKLANRKFINPVVLGFNIKTKDDIRFANQFADGAIVGSAFVKTLKGGFDRKRSKQFLEELR
ncbi:tryptophan synthase subunit alpha [Dyadobacter subterraneus]|uniref:Tryptophan synthase alpha chain n=1 Tax=Dyadobacter subterraneus TaxID=2773304 RepID=A0ABR9WBS8_9BACT|nr:tryptophan synthase subunit alpha [Dyadobacter subterraneus]MBE9462609.1 tryptophan synthase subunit alpha [Dyadobacter subterraneus]